ncbi:MAG: FAD-dependent oxidoreductase [Deltaproteobacteria bacterium]
MKRIAILGAGPASLAAAWNLSEPGLANEITIYQQGWRAGGLCSTGRVGPEQWINQNGTHYLFGCYTSTLSLLEAAYAVLAQHGDTRFGTFEEQLVRRDLLVIRQLYRGAWTDWTIPMPRRGGRATDASSLPPPQAAWQSLTRATFELLRDERASALLSQPEAHRTDGARGLVAGIRRLVESVEERLEGALLDGFSAQLAHAERAFEVLLVALDRGGDDAPIDALAKLLTALRDAALAILEPLGERSLEAHRLAILVDLGLTVAIGGLEDRAFTPAGLAALDALDFRAWLTKHRARESSVWSAPISVWYDAIAAYERGAVERPQASTCATLIGVARLLRYPASFAYQLSWEAGDSIIGPIVAALVHRGVRFAYFHRVWDVVPSADGARIERVELEQQLALHAEDPTRYDPFVPSVTSPGRAVWPVEPRWSEIRSPKPPGWVGGLSAELLRALPLDPAAAPGVHAGLESSYYPRLGPTVVLEAGRDFDVVIGAMGLKMYGPSAPSLIASSRAMRDALEHVAAGETQSLRFWLRPSLVGLGWTTQPPILSGYAEPFATWEDPTDCLASERWGASAPATVSHLFGPLPEAGGAQSEAYLQAQTTASYLHAAAWSRYNVGLLWPGASDRARPLALDAGAAVAIQVRANVGLEQLYTQILPGTADKRPAPGRTELANFVICGDWTRTQLLTGCVEGAVESGLRAAAAV